MVELRQEHAKRWLFLSQVWWHTSVILALGKRLQKNSEFKASLSYMRLSLDKPRMR